MQLPSVLYPALHRLSLCLRCWLSLSLRCWRLANLAYALRRPLGSWSRHSCCRKPPAGILVSTFPFHPLPLLRLWHPRLQQDQGDSRLLHGAQPLRGGPAAPEPGGVGGFGGQRLAHYGRQDAVEGAPVRCIDAGDSGGRGFGTGWGSGDVKEGRGSIVVCCGEGGVGFQAAGVAGVAEPGGAGAAGDGARAGAMTDLPRIRLGSRRRLGCRGGRCYY